MLELPHFNHAHLLVVGDVMLDRYWLGLASRISPEAPIPIVNIQQEEERPGGAANVALNIASLNAKVTLMGIVGNDLAAEQLTQQLHQHQIECLWQVVSDVPTITKLRILSHHQQLLRADFEQHSQQINYHQLTQDFEKALTHKQLIVLSDYHKGALFQVEKLIEIARKKQIPVLVDPKGTDFNRYRGATLISPNQREFENVFGASASIEAFHAKAQKALTDYDWQYLLVTHGEKGMTLISQHQPPIHLAAMAQEVFDVSGAGDTVIAVLATALASGLSIETAMQLSNRAAGLVVSRLGTSAITYQELVQLFRKTQHHKKIMQDEKQLLQFVKHCKQKGERIVITNGCFDLLHAGHVNYLSDAKTFGDRLIVLVNDDASVKKLKGAQRPINNLPNRMQVLAGLESIDAVCAFSEDTPARLIELITPHVLVKGGDYQVTQIAGAEHVIANGGSVQIIPLTPNCSTTNTLKNIQEQIV